VMETENASAKDDDVILDLIVDAGYDRLSDVR
jgi:hypothetical protein